MRIRIMCFKKYIFISSIMIATLVTSSNAACIATYCFTGEIGLGGVYHNINGGSLAHIDNRGGYLSIGGASIYKRLQAAGVVRLGGGVSTLSGQNLVSRSTKGFFIDDYFLRVGFNIASQNIPLYINFIANLDRFQQGLNGVNRMLFALGIELEGKIPIGKANIMYSGGYTWLAEGIYQFGKLDSHINGEHNYAIIASLGLSYDISNNASVYIKAIGKYYDLHASSVVDTNLSFPASHHFTAMLEIGINGVLYGYNRVQ